MCVICVFVKVALYCLYTFEQRGQTAAAHGDDHGVKKMKRFHKRSFLLVIIMSRLCRSLCVVCVHIKKASFNFPFVLYYYTIIQTKQMVYLNNSHNCTNIKQGSSHIDSFISPIVEPLIYHELGRHYWQL